MNIDWVMVLQGGALTIGVTVGVWLITLLYRKVLGREKPSENVLKALAFIASVVVAYFQIDPNLPSFAGDPTAYALALLATATTVFKAAQLLYDRIWKKVIGIIAPSAV